MAEPTILGPTDHGPEEGAGNYVSLDLGDGRYIHYEHLRPGSVRVEVGERVRRGDVVAQVGYTGNSGGPHLHMHVSDGRTPLGGEGLPWTLVDFRVTGTYPSFEVLGRSRPRPHDGVRRTGELPPPLAVIDFGVAGRSLPSLPASLHGGLEVDRHLPVGEAQQQPLACLLYTSPSPRD